MTNLTKLLELDCDTELSEISNLKKSDIINDLTNILVLTVIRHDRLADLLDKNKSLVNRYMKTLESLCKKKVNERINFESSSVKDIQELIEDNYTLSYSNINEDHACLHSDIAILIKQGLMLFTVAIQLKASHEAKHSEDKAVQKVLAIFNNFYFSYQSFETRKKATINERDVLVAVSEHSALLSDYCLDSYYDSLKVTFYQYNSCNILSTISRIK